MENKEMTLDQFTQALVEMGYKKHECANNDLEVFKKRNKRIDIYTSFDNKGIYYNVYYEKRVKSGTIEYNQHHVSFKKALSNIKTFERKMGR